jgi:hypothetical protein
MRFTRTLLLAASLIGAGSIAPAMADCVYPKTPAAAPNGNTATKEQMIASMEAVKTYNAEVDAYLGCLDEEEKKSLAAVGDDQEKAKQIHAVMTKKHDAAVDELRARADELNVQIRAYKAKNK